jgi:hypothetical protein
MECLERREVLLRGAAAAGILLLDKVLGPMVLLVASFFPFQTAYYLNGHSFNAESDSFVAKGCRLATGLSAHAPAQRAGAQRLRALAHPSRFAIDRNPMHWSRSSCPPIGGCPPEAESHERAPIGGAPASTRSFRSAGGTSTEASGLRNDSPACA